MISQTIPILKNKKKKKKKEEKEDVQIKKVNGLLQREEFPPQKKSHTKTQCNQTAKKLRRRLVAREKQLVCKGISTWLAAFLAQTNKGWKEQEQYIYVQKTLPAKNSIFSQVTGQK